MHHLVITSHARERMKKYKVTEELVIATLEKPDITVEGHSGRKISQRGLDGHILRVVTEETKGIKTIITIYKAKREGMRYRYDPKTDILLMILKSGKPDFGKQSGNVITHYNKKGMPIEIEILDAKRTLIKAIQGKKLLLKH